MHITTCTFELKFRTLFTFKLGIYIYIHQALCYIRIFMTHTTTSVAATIYLLVITINLLSQFICQCNCRLYDALFVLRGGRSVCLGGGSQSNLSAGGCCRHEY